MDVAPHAGSRPHAGATRQPVVAVVLAAGAGTRFRTGHPDVGDGGHKLSAKLSAPGVETGPTVLGEAIRRALDAAIGPVVVVTGAMPDIVAEVVPAGDLDRIVVCHNPDWADGQITSLRAGVRCAGDLGAEAVVVGLGDQPFIDPDAWRDVAAADSPIAVATYEGRRGHPVRLAADVWELLPETGDEGARGLMRVRPELVREVPCTGSPADIDTTEDLHRWLNS